MKGHTETQCEKYGDGGDIMCAQAMEEPSTVSNTSRTSQEEEEGEEQQRWSNCDSAEDVSKNTQENHKKKTRNDNQNNANDNKQNKKKGKKGQEEVVEKIDFPEPRLPYPYVSNLTANDQKRYLYMMSSKTPKEPNMVCTGFSVFNLVINSVCHYAAKSLTSCILVLEGGGEQGSYRVHEIPPQCVKIVSRRL